ncbi:Piso0_005369 [Millerozyma farinosa CBS 7064]|uniref:Piso0_005369 protein n=1 Tax=Pichia sorbitophila (strain ATCC MYA-4447 / BCRC 22081 / CBS 7064 / NBRC 10061 / NRRL Y-12695) TaxID=559304 RepID=G8Y4X5_PICSO|nr:Piso0_005369 [Millerozyma farinosa CBS 7064]
MCSRTEAFGDSQGGRAVRAIHRSESPSKHNCAAAASRVMWSARAVSPGAGAGRSHPRPVNVPFANMSLQRSASLRYFTTSTVRHEASPHSALTSDCYKLPSSPCSDSGRRRFCQEVGGSRESGTAPWTFVLGGFRRQ